MKNGYKVIRHVLEKDVELRSVGKQLYVDLAKKYRHIGLLRIDKEPQS